MPENDFHHPVKKLQLRLVKIAKALILPFKLASVPRFHQKHATVFFAPTNFSQ